MPMREAHARWVGNIEAGQGHVDFGGGAFEATYSFASRFKNAEGTNPEELLGAAHASCFAMALSLILGKAGHEPDYVDAIARVTVSPHQGGFRITSSNIVCEASVPGIDEAAFLQWANAAKAGCPVSQALAGVEIKLDARLVPADLKKTA